MLMMLASWGQVVQIGPADAHDAGFLGAMLHQLGRLMLMTLAFWDQVVQIGPADAHDAGFLRAMWHQLGPADTDDVGFLGPSGPNRPG